MVTLPPPDFYSLTLEERTNIEKASRNALDMRKGILAGSGVVIKAEKPHKCVEPCPKAFDNGDQFVCRCGKHYTLVVFGGPYWRLDP